MIASEFAKIRRPIGDYANSGSSLAADHSSHECCIRAASPWHVRTSVVYSRATVNIELALTALVSDHSLYVHGQSLTFEQLDISS